MAKYEVTFAEWDECVDARGCEHKPDDEGWGRGKRPVINVSWEDITKQFVPWLTRKTGKTYQLLTEAEWEYAARAGSTTRFHFGNDEKDLSTYGNVDGAAVTDGNCSSRTMRGGSWIGNPVGVRSASRSSATPDIRDNYIGFRLSRTLNPTQ